MKVIIFGASGMVGQGVLRECVVDDRVESVLLVSRAPLGRSHPKIREVIHRDFTDFSAIEDEFAGLDACFFCLGVSAAGRSEEEYRRVTHDYTLAGARSLFAHNPSLTFAYVSGEGTDSTEQGRSLWARVKGRTENDLLALGFHAYMFRPGYIQPRHGARSRTRWYRLSYALTSWLYPVLRRLAPGYTTTTEHLGRAMLAVVDLQGNGERILYSREINRLGA
ncbi:epimerase [Streptomyces sp. H10-C2]|uniref:NAD-dependent epimerase/dehydratase family protein n=1 Tax=unclassified Streptomyces TaxID=2593676 RepID=UPI0024B9F1CA|nr:MULTISPECIES: NAD-dependent epimerase/dehydratase family protein [unclassified Streptomyces]MDJ0343584.1 epimerase [Streptomyces sp. PH10-H1]MDJ0373168.1 epimerase [Streptomyces sp. H10-C2]